MSQVDTTKQDDDADDPSTPERDWVDKVIGNPITGFAPWIVLSVIEGPGTIALACAIAFAMSAAVLIIEKIRGASPKILSFVDVVAFGAFLIGSLVVSPGTTTWLETWFGEIANIVLVLVVLISMLARQPFTLQYAREQTSPDVWDSPVFLRINYVITGVWGLAFLVDSIAGFIGDAILHSDNNIWTGWIIQILAALVAVAFTDWYPDYGAAKAMQDAGIETDAPPSPWTFWAACAGFLVPCGIASLIFDSDAWMVGVGLIVAGAVLRAYCTKRAGTAPEPDPATA